MKNLSIVIIILVVVTVLGVNLSSVSAAQYEWVQTRTGSSLPEYITNQKACSGANAAILQWIPQIITCNEGNVGKHVVADPPNYAYTYTTQAGTYWSGYAAAILEDRSTIRLTSQNSNVICTRGNYQYPPTTEYECQSTVADDYQPEGILEGATCDYITGWIHDQDDLGQAINVHYYVNDVFEGVAIADLYRSDVGDHIFQIATPESLKTGTDQTIKVYGINIKNDGSEVGSGNAELLNSPKTLTCEPVSTIVDDYDPIGYHDLATCEEIKGWAVDEDTPNDSINVHIYDGQAGSGGTMIANITTDIFRLGVNEVVGVTGNHGFSLPPPESLIDGNSHDIYVYAIDSSGEGINTLLSNSPQTLNCLGVTWDVALDGDLLSGATPLNVNLTANGAGTAEGNIDWKFDCTNDGIWEKEVTTTNSTDTFTCTYSVAGNYIAKVSSIKGVITAEDTIEITASIPTPPDVVVTGRTESDYCESDPAIFVEWSYTGANLQEYYQIEIHDNNTFTSLVFDSGKILSLAESSIPNLGLGDLVYNTDYSGRVKVWDTAGSESEWASFSWTTPAPLSQPDFSWEPQEVLIDEEIQFTDMSSPPPFTYLWSFGDGNSSVESDPINIYEDDGNKSVTLTTGNASGETCSVIKDLSAKKKPPIWKEILPNLWFFVPLPGLEPGSSGPKPDVLSIILQGLFFK